MGKKYTKIYMHLINGRSGEYHNKEQICYASLRGVKVEDMPNSLKQLRKEQEMSRKWRLKNGYDTMHDYGYQIILIN